MTELQVVVNKYTPNSTYMGMNMIEKIDRNTTVNSRHYEYQVNEIEYKIARINAVNELSTCLLSTSLYG